MKKMMQKINKPRTVFLESLMLVFLMLFGNLHGCFLGLIYNLQVSSYSIWKLTFAFLKVSKIYTVHIICVVFFIKYYTGNFYTVEYSEYEYSTYFWYWKKQTIIFAIKMSSSSLFLRVQKWNICKQFWVIFSMFL